MPLAVLSLGSNVPLGALSPPEILAAACGNLGAALGNFRVSPVYRTKPLYYAGQEDFYNLAACGEWAASAEALLDLTQGIEARFGRNRAVEIPKGPRTLDIDIALFGNHIIETPRLRIPHPGITGRAFVLVPLLALLPGWVDPRSGKKYRSFLDCLPQEGVQLATGETRHGTGI